MKKTALLSLILVLCGLYSCKKDDVLPKPVVDFTFTVPGYAPAIVIFTSNCENSTQFAWNFGDGTTSTLKNPEKTYFLPGTYTVSLTASGEGGSESIEKQIIVSEQPILPISNFTFLYNPQTVPANVTFTNMSQHSQSYIWNFGDGTNSTEISPSHIYNVAGTYRVTLKAINQHGNSVFYQDVIITEQIQQPYMVDILAVATPVIPLDIAWDAFSGPDVFFKAYLSNSMQFDGTDYRINDVTESTMSSLIWIFDGEGIRIHTFSTKLTIDVYDYDDFDSDDLMTSIDFYMSNYMSGSNAYPTMVSKTINGVKVDLYLAWYFAK